MFGQVLRALGNSYKLPNIFLSRTDNGLYDDCAIKTMSLKQKPLNINWPFLLLIGLQLVLYFFFILLFRIPAGHDGFSGFYSRYYFLNSAVTARELPLWIPYTTHGTLASWAFYVQSGICQNLWLLLGLLAGPLMKNINYIIFYHVSMFCEELLLLTGTWLLARRLFPSRLSAFVTTVTVMGSCVWMLQPAFNLYLFYAIPLIFYLFHRFLDTGRWRWFFLSGSLATLQYLGTAPYFLAVSSFAGFVYFGTYILFHREVIKKIRINPSAGLALAGILIGLAAFGGLIYIDGGDIMTFDLGRTTSGETSLASFMTHGRNLGWTKWGELFLGISPTADMALYFGYLPLLLLPLTFFTPEGWQNKHILVTIILLILFSSGTWFSRLMYYIWPMMKFFRHLGLIAPMIKFFICLWAGCGVEALVRIARDPAGQIRPRKVLILLSTVILFVSLTLFFISRDNNLLLELVSGLTERSAYITEPKSGQLFFLSGLESFFDNALLPNQLFSTMVTAFLVGLLGVGLALNVDKKKTAFLLTMLVGVHVVSLYNYKFFQAIDKTISVAPEFHSVGHFTETPYIYRRQKTMLNDNTRTRFLKELKVPSFYWTVYAYFFHDEIGHSTRTDYWMRPFNDFMKTYWGQDLKKEAEPPKGLAHNVRLNFPLDHPAAVRIGGLTADKIQFFRQAFAVKSREKTAELMSAEAYQGGFLFLEQQATGLKPWSPAEKLALDTHLDLNYKVTDFDTNNLKLTVTVPPGQPVWLLYSDVWHPVWKARINGQRQPVFKANLAYKAVQLMPGKNTVHFFARDARLQLLYFFWILVSVGWLGYMTFLTGKCLGENCDPEALTGAP